MFNLEHVEGWMLQYEHVLRTQQNQLLDSADAMLMSDPNPHYGVWTQELLLAGQHKPTSLGL